MAFQILSKNEVYKGKYMSLLETHFLDKKGNKRVWESASKQDFISVLAITKDKELVFVKQYRIPNERYCYQPVAGWVEVGETNVQAAERELMEETGYKAEKFIPLRPVLNAPGSLTNSCYPFIALNAYQVNKNTGDETEDIEVVKIPADTLYEFYQNCPVEVDFGQRIIACYEVAKNLGLI